MHTHDTNNHHQPDDDLADLMHRVDIGTPPDDEELERLAEHGRCFTCGRRPDADPADYCETPGFHQTTADAASETPQDEKTSDTPHENDTGEDASTKYLSHAERRALIREGLQAIMRPGDVHEVRIPKPRDKRKGTTSGYVDDVDQATDAVMEYAMDNSAEAIYITVNPVNPALLARSPNELTERAELTTADKDVLHRKGLLIDVDPDRPSGISATDKERDAALKTTQAIRDYLHDLGWPDPVIDGSSGNGGLLLYRIDLPNDAAGTALVKNALEHLADGFNTDAVTIDTTVSNAARIMKIPGTVAAKGKQTADRLYRNAIVQTNLDAGTVSREQFEALVSLDAEQEPTASKQQTKGKQSRAEDTAGDENATDATGAARSEIEAALKSKGIGYTIKRRDSRIIFDLDTCLTSDAHEGGACITVFPSGARSYRCLHDSCRDKRWQDVAALLGFGERNRSSGQKDQTARPQAFNAADLLRRTFAPVHPIVTDRLTEGLHINAGAPKIGKSWAMMDLGRAVATGETWLDADVPEPGDALYLALEDSPRRLRSRLAKIMYGGMSANSSYRGEQGPDDDFVIDLSGMPPMPERLTFWTECPPLDKGGLDRISTWLDEHPDAKLVIIDTLGKIRPARSKNGSAYDDDYAALTGLQQLAGKHKVAIVVVHHLRKMTSEDPLEQISGTMAISGAADGLMVMQRQRGTDTATLFITGRDVEHEQTLALSFNATTARWSVLGDAEELQRTQEQREVIDVLRDAGEALTPSQVAERLGQPVNRIKTRLFRMSQRHQINNENGKYSYEDPKNL